MCHARIKVSDIDNARQDNTKQDYITTLHYYAKLDHTSFTKQDYNTLNHTIPRQRIGACVASDSADTYSTFTLQNDW